MTDTPIPPNLEPVLTQVQEILDRLPAGERGLPRSLDFFKLQAKPKHHGRHAAVREIAAVLRLLGWTRKRRWNESPFIAVWCPPEKEVV